MADYFELEVPQRMSVVSPYCADPDCVYCKDLRETQNDLSRGKHLVPRDDGEFLLNGGD